MARKPVTTKTMPKVALALGGGGARGIAHIVVLEALDELGIRPVSITGCSIGAIIGAAYAAGTSGKDLRKHVLTLFKNRTDVMERLFTCRVGRLADIWSRGLGNPLLVDGELVLNKMLPRPLPESFADLQIPFRAIATDYYALSRAVLSEGPLNPAVAGSMALPWLVRPVQLHDRVLVDGGAVDPLPTHDADPGADLVIAVDITGGMLATDQTKLPTPLEGIFGMSLILQSALTEALLASTPGHVQVLRPNVQSYGVLDFFKVKQILADSEPMRAQVRALLGA